MNSTSVAERKPVVRRHMPELDTLRGIAVLMVVLYHGLGWRYVTIHEGPSGTLLLKGSLVGWTGVNLFFVLSGFLITGILLETRSRPDYYQRFYWRRALRILPVFLLVVLAILVTGRTDGKAFFVSLFFLADIAPLLGASLPIGVLWSLAVEEQFYFAWPTVVRHVSERTVWRAAVGVVAVMPVCRLVGYFLGARGGLGHYPWFVADGLALGAALAVTARRPVGEDRVAVRRFALVCGGLAVACFVVAHAAGPLTRSQSPVGAAMGLSLVNLGYGAIVATALLLGSGPWRHWVRSSVLVFFGSISYGLYLMHVPIYDVAVPFWARITGHSTTLRPPSLSMGEILLRLLVGVGVAVILATISRWTFEAWFLRRKGWIDRRRAATIAATGVQTEA